MKIFKFKSEEQINKFDNEINCKCIGICGSVWIYKHKNNQVFINYCGDRWTFQKNTEDLINFKPQTYQELVEDVKLFLDN